jgi:hypothetical protein
MSSLTIVQEHDRITFAVDTAHCWGDCNLEKYRYYDEKVQKICKAGLDMVFIAGMTECTEQVKKDLCNFINKKNHINVELLKQYLKREYPKEKSKYLDTGLNDVGVTVLSVVNSESIVCSFNQDNNYELSISKARHNEVKLFFDGFDNERIYKYALRYIKTLKGFAYRDPKTFIDVYQNNYLEGVGGYIQIYSLDCAECKMLVEHKLDEHNLRYVVSKSSLGNINLTELSPSFSSLISAAQIMGGTISGTDIEGVSITGGTITGTVINGVTINGATINGGEFNSSDEHGSLNIDGSYIQGYNSSGELKLDIDTNGNIACGNVACSTLNGYVPITSNNIGSQSVSSAGSAGSAFTASIAYKLYKSNTTQNAYISDGDNLIPSSNQMYIGSSINPWAGGYGVSGWITTSDERKKNSIQPLDERYLQFAKLLVPKSFKMNEGTSGRTHVGFIAQEVEEAMTACGISDMEFAGLIKAPVFSKKLVDEDGSELNEYDTTSEVTGYDYALRYDEFIPLLFADMKAQEDRIAALESKLSI